MATKHNAECRFPGINQELLDSVLMPTDKSAAKDHYNVALVETLINIISHSCQNGKSCSLLELGYRLIWFDFICLL